MKIYASTLALCLPATAAFVIKAPAAFTAATGRTIAYSSPTQDLSAPALGSAPDGGPFSAVPGGSLSPSLPDAKPRWDDRWDALPPEKVQGGALKTWSFATADLDRVYLSMITEGPPEGNPCHAFIELHQGPDNTPQVLDVFSGKGRLRPSKLWIETPGEGSAVFIRNLSPVEFPLYAGVGTEMKGDTEPGVEPLSDAIYDMCPDEIVQGGAVKTYDLDESVSTVKVVLTTDGRPLNAVVELIQGPNATKYVIKIYTENGMIRPFNFVMQTPGAGNTVRIVNSGTIEFPLIASVGPNTV